MPSGKFRWRDSRGAAEGQPGAVTPSSAPGGITPARNGAMNPMPSEERGAACLGSSPCRHIAKRAPSDDPRLAWGGSLEPRPPGMVAWLDRGMRKRRRSTPCPARKLVPSANSPPVPTPSGDLGELMHHRALGDGTREAMPGRSAYAHTAALLSSYPRCPTAVYSCAGGFRRIRTNIERYR